MEVFESEIKAVRSNEVGYIKVQRIHVLSLRNFHIKQWR
jgi:hypothetical protein